MYITLSINVTRTALHEFSYLELLWYTLLILWRLRSMNLRGTHFMFKNSNNHTPRWSFISSRYQLWGIIKFIASFLLMHILADTMNFVSSCCIDKGEDMTSYEQWALIKYYLSPVTTSPKCLILKESRI